MRPKEPRPEWAVLLDTQALVTVEQAQTILAYKDKDAVKNLIYNGRLIAHCPNGPGTKPMKITSSSLKSYLKKYVIDPDDWNL